MTDLLAILIILGLGLGAFVLICLAIGIRALYQAEDSR